jgi:hypothetical protein
LLQHHFWGNYYASLVLVFESKEAVDAVESSGSLNGEAWGTWKRNPKSDKVLNWHGPGEKFEALKKRLVALGADPKKIDSVAKSIDYGEKFFVEVHADDPRQQSLFG